MPALPRTTIQPYCNAVLELLRQDVTDRELLLANGMIPVPPGWRPYSWLSYKFADVEGPKYRRWNLLASAVQVLSREGKIDLVRTRSATGKTWRSRWIRIKPEPAVTVCGHGDYGVFCES